MYGEAKRWNRDYTNALDFFGCSELLFYFFLDSSTSYPQCFHPFPSRIKSLSVFSLPVNCTQHSWELLDQISHQNITSSKLLMLREEVFTLTAICLDNATGSLSFSMRASYPWTQWSCNLLLVITCSLYDFGNIQRYNKEKYISGKSCQKALPL